MYDFGGIPLQHVWPQNKLFTNQQKDIKTYVVIIRLRAHM